MATSTIPANVLNELNRQLNHELGAAHAYLALSHWCLARNLKGFAAFFAKQSAEEREHADKFIRHALDRRAAPVLAALAAPKQEFENLLAVAIQAQAMEQANTRGIHAVYEAALAAKDYPTQVLMHWFIQEQVEEEAWAAEMVERIQATNCAGGWLDLDRHITKLLEDGAGD
jgi:ferritin